MIRIKKISLALAIGAVTLMLSPVGALAHGDDDGDRDFRSGVNAFAKFDGDKGDRDDDRSFRASNLDNILNASTEVRMGTISAKGSSSFTLNANDGKVYTVNIGSATILNLPFHGTLAFADLKVNDKARVRGAIDGTTISATSIVVLPVNNQPAKAKGTVTAKSGSNLTLQTTGGNTVSVNTTTNTTVTKADGSSGTLADVAVGAMVKVKGLWDSVLNVFNAIKIRIL